MAARMPSGFLPRTFISSRPQVATPRPVASLRPLEPQYGIGLPVNTPGSSWPRILVRVSLNHTISWPPVLRSGAGTSCQVPMIGAMRAAKVRDTRSFSFLERTRGSQQTPPLPPP